MAKATTGKTAGKKKTFRKKERKNIPNGIVHIAASFNNTMISITDTEGNLIAQSSSGALAFSGSRKGTPYAAQQAAYEAAVASQPSALSTAQGFASPSYATRRPSRTTAAARRSGAEYKQRVISDK